jgi:hypothetical protein
MLLSASQQAQCDVYAFTASNTAADLFFQHIVLERKPAWRMIDGRYPSWHDNSSQLFQLMSDCCSLRASVDAADLQPMCQTRTD